MRSRLATLLLVVLLLAACGGGDDATPTTAVAPATTAAPAQATTPAPSATTTATPAENAALCDAFLAFRGAQDPGTVGSSLQTLAGELGSEAPSAVFDAVTAFQTGDFGDAGVGGSIVALRDYIVPLCHERYYEGVVGAGDDETAAHMFFDAAVAGNRAAAESIAHDEVIAQFEPWSGYGGETTVEVTSGGFVMRLGPDAIVTCETREGVVERCVYG